MIPCTAEFITHSGRRALHYIVVNAKGHKGRADRQTNHVQLSNHCNGNNRIDSNRVWAVTWGTKAPSAPCRSLLMNPPRACLLT